MRRPSPPLLDIGLAAALLVLGQAEAWTPWSTSLGGGSQATAAALSAIACVAVAFRRWHPLAVAALVALPTPVVGAFTSVRLLFFGGLLPLLLATYTLAATRRTRRDLLALLVPAAAMAALQVEVPAFHQAGEIVFDWLCLGAATAVGWAVAVRQLKVEQTEGRAAGLERAAVSEERARIARELHDVIAHSMSVIVVQAGAAEPLVEEDPDHVRQALQTIRATGTEALAEMRRMVGIMREHDEQLALAPQPSVERLQPLVERARAGGVDVEVSVEGTPRPLPPGLDLAAYRVVQEAVTNVGKHSGARSARVLLRYTPGAVELEVTDDGRGSAAANGSGGHGLIGMRERVALYGGELAAGPASGGGFSVRVTLPTG